ncbi:MAG: hypothetical protein ACYCTK_08620 [Acidithiobacillus ferrooxidans]
MDLRFWKKKDASINDADELVRVLLSFSNQTLFQKFINFFHLALDFIVDEFFHYLFSVGFRTLLIWFILQWALGFYEPQARLWIIAIVLAQIWGGMRYIKVKIYRQRLLLIISFCAYFSISLMQQIPNFGSRLILPFGIVLVGPLFIWMSRHEEEE